MTARLLIEYDGTRFAGWASQPGQRTIQDQLEHALAVLLRRPGVELTVAGRTDAGVHAWGQVASYEGEPVPIEGLNALLPEDVAVLDCGPAPDGFNARHDASSRAYCYRVLARPGRSALERGRVLHWTYEVAFDALCACAAELAGEHDFTAFTPLDTYHVRFERVVLSAFWRRAGSGALAGGGGGASAGERALAGGGGGAPAPGGELFEFWIEADTFMRHMNRVLVGTMLEVAAGKRTVEQFRALLTGRPRTEAGPTAPAHGLYLVGVGYEGERVLGG